SQDEEESRLYSDHGPLGAWDSKTALSGLQTGAGDHWLRGVAVHLRRGNGRRALRQAGRAGGRKAGIRRAEDEPRRHGVLPERRLSRLRQRESGSVIGLPISPAMAERGLGAGWA